MALLAGTADAAAADRLINRLAAHDITYLVGGTGNLENDPGETALPATHLMADLLDAPSVRVVDTLIALLLRHPEYVLEVRSLLVAIGEEDPRYRPLLARILAAAALQYIWGFVLRNYLGNQPRIPVTDLCERLRLPLPHEEHGEALLRAAAQLLDPSGIINWATSWEDAADQLLTDLCLKES